MRMIIKQLEGYRKAKGLSQEAMARRLGVSLGTYRNWIQGFCDPSPLAEERITRFLRRIDNERSKKKGGKW